MRPNSLIALAACLPVLQAQGAEPFKPNLGPELPAITVSCGDLTLLLRQSSQWTPGRIDFRGKTMTTERSAYGTVFSFPGIGFIGTAHLENEPEELISLSFHLDGKELEHPGAELRGTTFRLIRESKIRDLRLTCVIELKDHRLFETTTVSTDREVPLKVAYHFMHAWVPTVSDYLAGMDASPNESIEGSLPDTEEAARLFHIQRRVDWMAVLEPVSGQFGVSRLLSAPEAGGHFSMIWNVPGSYRKYYLRCFDHETIPAGFSGTWRMVTAFGKSGAGSWKAQAEGLARELGKTK